MHIYLITDGIYYKIGITSKDPNVRLNELQTGNPNILSLITSFKTKHDYLLESTLHRYFKLQNVNNEWFDLSIEQVDSFIKLCEKFEYNIGLIVEQDFD